MRVKTWKSNGERTPDDSVAVLPHLVPLPLGEEGCSTAWFGLRMVWRRAGDRCALPPRRDSEAIVGGYIKRQGARTRRREGGKTRLSRPVPRSDSWIHVARHSNVESPRCGQRSRTRHWNVELPLPRHALARPSPGPMPNQLSLYGGGRSEIPIRTPLRLRVFASLR